MFDAATDEYITDLCDTNCQLLVAAGGAHGYGNAHFRSATNQAPRQKSLGQPCEARQLRLELRLLADVGLLGLPNAGKSTLLAAISAAQPKIGNYPFTTITPTLGTVKSKRLGIFVVADLPGLIEGAAQGLGLGTRFLRHVQRTRLLLHLVEITTIEKSVQAVKTIENEMRNVENLIDYPRWLVCSKADCCADAAAYAAELGKRLQWKAPLFLFLQKQGRISNHL